MSLNATSALIRCQTSLPPTTRTVPPTGPSHGGLARSHKFGYLLARMRYEILLAPSAVEELRALRAHVGAQVRDAIEHHLRHEPTRVSKSRIKRLRGLSRPRYRLRIDDVRVFYDVTQTRVEVLAIIPKAQAKGWLAQEGRSD